MPGNLFFFTGEEMYLLQEKIRFWKEEFIKKHGDFNLSILDADETSLADVISAMGAMPFLGDRRLIFVHGLPDRPKTRQTEEPSKKEEKRDEALAKLGSELEKIPETSVVVFVQSQPDKRKSFYKKLSASAQVKEFNILKGAELSAWIKNRFIMNGATIDGITCDYLVSIVGQNLWRLSQEINKLTSHSFGEPITKMQINQLVTPTLEANVFHLTDALGVKNAKKAIRHLHDIASAGENLRQIFFMIVRQFRLLIQAEGYHRMHPGASPTAFSAALKLHPFVARNIMAQIRHFEFKNLKMAYEKLLEIDVDLKTSRIKTTTDNQDELALIIERFILDFCGTSV